MRRERIPPIARQIIDEQLVAEIIFPLPINSMRFNGVASFLSEQYKPPAWLQNTNHFADGGAVVLHVFDHLVAEDQVAR